MGGDPGPHAAQLTTLFLALPPDGSGCSTDTTRGPKWIRNTGEKMVSRLTCLKGQWSVILLGGPGPALQSFYMSDRRHSCVAGSLGGRGT